MLKCRSNSPVTQCETSSPRDGPASSNRDSVVDIQHSPVRAWSSDKLVEEQAWILDPWCRRITRLFAKFSPQTVSTRGAFRVYRSILNCLRKSLLSAII